MAIGIVRERRDSTPQQTHGVDRAPANYGYVYGWLKEGEKRGSGVLSNSDEPIDADSGKKEINPIERPEMTGQRL